MATLRDIEQTLQTQARSLDSFRGQFTNYALRLTTPMAEAMLGDMGDEVLGRPLMFSTRENVPMARQNFLG